MLVIDRVELETFDEPHQVRNLDADDTVRRQEDSHPVYEVVELGDLRKDVVGHDQVGLPMLGDEPVCET
jgi:hypothetical protein